MGYTLGHGGRDIRIESIAKVIEETKKVAKFGITVESQFLDLKEEVDMTKAAANIYHFRPRRLCTAAVMPLLQNLHAHGRRLQLYCSEPNWLSGSHNFAFPIILLASSLDSLPP